MKEKFRPQPENQQQKSPENGVGSLGLPPPDQNQSSSEAERDYSAMLSSIRAYQDRESFVADLHQNGKQLLSLAKNLVCNRGDTQEERGAYQSLGIYLDAVLKMHVFDINPFSNNPASDYPDEDSDEPLTAAERREIIAFRATQRVALKWLDGHPDSEAAESVARLGIYADSLDQEELLKEMWSSIRDISTQF